MQDMAGLFRLGGGSSTGGVDREEDRHHHHLNSSAPGEINPNSTNTQNIWNNIGLQPPSSSSTSGLLLYRNEEIYQKGYEIWQQYVQVHQYPKLIHHHLSQPPQAGPSSAQYYPFQYHHYPFSSAGASSSTMFRPNPPGSSSSSRGIIVTGVGSAMNCQDCGNQAKKDCLHMQCRTCCRSRGFDCPTHVKSTWVPAAKRRERQQQQEQRNENHQIMSDGSKRLRENTTAARDLVSVPAVRASSSSSAGLEVAQHFPSEVSSDAIFRCVRLHSIEEAEDQLAYQTSVNISGHLFKGILYDQGPNNHNSSQGNADGASSSSLQLQHHNLLSSTAATHNTTAGENHSVSGAVPNLLDPTVYPTPINAFLTDAHFFPPPPTS